MLVSEIPPLAVRLFGLLFGAAWGSFFNVAIYRWPRGMSVVHPPSRCGGCGTPVPPLRNLPIVGFLLLRGRTACCGAPLSPRYLLIELIGAGLGLAMVERFIVDAHASMELVPAAIEALLYFGFAGGLVVATFVDLEWLEIPDEVSLPGAAVGLATVALREAPGAADAALGAGVGFLATQLVLVWGWERLFGRRGMGEGDPKLLLMIGAFLGLYGVLFCIVAGAMQGLVVALSLRALGRSAGPTAQRGIQETSAFRRGEPMVAPPADATPVTRMAVPFGPFLALGALEYLYFGDLLLERYLSLFE